ncbi:MAG: M1 family metallopeptidase [Bacteroidota bacterium]
MKSFLLSILLLGNVLLLTAQKDYFQQETNYTIKATLDDEQHMLSGEIKIEYINNSPDELNELYFHLWPNAYANKETAFAKQKLRQGSTKFHYASERNMGGITQLNFLVDGQVTSYTLYEDNPDIVVLQLPQPLGSGTKTQITTPFRLKIPASYSRLGHVKTSYQLTQWYPKPAVYDHKGWHPMPYLDQGEFYSEFGSFDVTLTLPKNYVVGATGTLQTPTELDFLKEKVVETQAYFAGDTTLFAFKNDFPASDTTLKTIRYTAENVHDFAWFADKRFKVLYEEATLQSGKKVDSWAMFTHQEEKLWQKAAAYVQRAVEFYSEHVGEYPWPQATAVQSALSAGAGMEYPMITVIGQSGSDKALDEVITHEVGHNWFYGILAPDERVYPWIDEGINSYYEYRYMDIYYKENALDDAVPSFLRDDSGMGVSEAAYLLLARKNADQAPNTHSDSLTSLNYGIAAYVKPALAFRHLEAYLGQTVFDAAMQSFYQNWKFKHPYPEDVETHFEEATGKNLNWFFKGYIGSTDKLDYAIRSVKIIESKPQIRVKNKADLAAPFPLDFLRKGEVVQTQWIEGFKNEQIISLPAGDYDAVSIDHERVTLDTDRRDNMAQIDGFPKIATPLRFNLLARIGNDRSNALSFAPALSFNNYDKFMLGALIHNLSIPTRNLEFALMPMYGFKSNELVGLGTMRYSIYPTSNLLQRISLQLNARRFSYDFDDHYAFHNHYLKFAPKLELEFKKSIPTSPITQKLHYRYIKIWQDNGRGQDFEARTFTREQRDYEVHEVEYALKKSTTLNPADVTATIHHGTGFTKAFAHFNQKINYAKPRKFMRIHAFGGYFFNYNEPLANARFLISGTNGFGIFQKDYLYDEFMIGRNDTEGVFANQIFYRDANLKTISNISSSDAWMLGGGLRSTLPGLLPLDIYADLALSPDAFEDKINLNYSIGLAVPVVRNVLEIYVPVLESSMIKESSIYQQKDSFFERVTFRINLDRFSPFRLIDGIGE